MDGSYSNTAFDNRWLAKQYGNVLVTKEVQTQLRKDKHESKDKQKSENEQKGKETDIEEINKTEDKQRSKETGVEKANELDKPSRLSDELDEFSESSSSDCLFVPTV